MTPAVARSAAGVGSPTALREANRARVLESLRRDGPASKSELARRTGLSRATVFNIVGDLTRDGIVRLVPDGSRVQQVEFSAAAGVAIGIDVDHRRLRVAVADLNHRVLAEQTVPLTEGAPADETVATAAELVEALLDRAGAGHEDAVGVGMCLPAPIDAGTGQVGSTSILPGWIGVPAAEAVSWKLGLPVVVDNDANLGALAEATWGAARGATDVVYLKLGAGVGGGLIIGGELYRGATGTAGEIGHNTVDDRGPLCRCGNRGCLESYVGAEWLLAPLRTAYGAELGLADAIAKAAAGDAACQRVIADAGRHVGLAVANVCNLLAPERVVVGGELTAAGEGLLEPIRQALHRHAIHPAGDRVAIVPAELGDRAEVLGAIAMVLRDDRLALRAASA